MLQSLVLTVIGPDRPGLVDALSATIREHGGNWHESRLAKLAGQFAGVVRVEVPADQAGALSEALRELTAQGLVVTSTTDAAEAESATPKTLHLEFLGHDRPGLVRDVAHALAVRGFNITELTSRVRSAAMSGEPMFNAVVTLTAPADADVAGLHDQLEGLANEMALDLTLTEANAPA